jgi:phage-related protein
LKKLSKEEKKSIGTDLKIVEFNWPIGIPLVKNLGDGIWEVRSNLPGGKICRIMFFIHRKQMILLNGFIKKTQKTPMKEIILEKQRKHQFEINERLI